jgi:hypothetical protein
MGSAMCAEDPTKRISMIEVTHRLESIQNEADRYIWSDDEDFKPTPQFVNNIDAYVIPGAASTVHGVLQNYRRTLRGTARDDRL